MAKKQIATFLGPQLGLTVIGDHCLAFSGLIASTNGTIGSAPTMLDFATGDKFLRIKVYYTDTETSNYTRYIRFLINNNIVMDWASDGAPPLSTDSAWQFIIPPFSRFEALANINGVTDNMGLMLNGTVHIA